MEKHRGLVYIPVTLKVGDEGEGYNMVEEVEDALSKLHVIDDMYEILTMVDTWGYDPENAEISTNPREHTFALGLPDDLTP